MRSRGRRTRCSRAVSRGSSARRWSSTCPGRRAAVATGSPSCGPRSSTRSGCSLGPTPRTARRRHFADVSTTAVPPLPVRFARLVKIEHTVFALPFAYVGAFLAVGGVPSTHDLVWITLAMVGARSLAMGLNRLIDAELDARNPRTASRELPGGQLQRWQVVAFCAAALALFVLSVF